MPATGNTHTGPSGQRRGGGRRSGTAPHNPPDGALAREAVISFLRDASKATAEREAARASDPAATQGGPAGSTETAALASELSATLGDTIRQSRRRPVG